jgi:hypothetical protein
MKSIIIAIFKDLAFALLSSQINRLNSKIDKLQQKLTKKVHQLEVKKKEFHDEHEEMFP